MSSSPFKHFRSELSRLGSRLDRPDASRDAEEIKREIIALYREVDENLGALASLKDDILSLIGRWKSVTRDTPEGGTEVRPAEGWDAPPARSGAVTPPPAPSSPVSGAAPDAPIATTPAGGPQVRSDHLGASTFIERGWSQIAAGDPVAAESSLRRALQLAPDEPATEALLGWAMVAQEKFDEALMVFNRVLERDPENALARVNVGYICLKKGIWGEAIEHLTRAVQLDNDRKATLYAHFYLGLVYMDRQMFEDARAFFEQAVSIGPNLVEAYYELGRATWYAGDRDGAREAWQSGFAANKFNAWGKRCAEMLSLVEAGGEPPLTG